MAAADQTTGRALTRELRSGSRIRTWARRMFTVPLYLLLLAATVLAFPALLLVAAAADWIRGGPWPRVRCLAFLTFYLACEALGIAVLTGQWLVTGFGLDSERLERWSHELTGWWANLLLAGAMRIFRMRLDVRGLDGIGDGPLLLFVRHASVGDTLLSATLITHRRRLLLRYVMKRELLWDPCLDIGGGRFPNYFVHRGSSDGAREAMRVQRLLDGLGPGNGVIIYPEGTRFTREKRERILDRLSRDPDPKPFDRARRLGHVLPPRPGGTLALLGGNPGADVVFCAHVGFDAVTTFHDLTNGGLVDRTIRVEFWRVPYDEVPKGRAEQEEWLFAQWRRMDEWVAKHQEPEMQGPASAP